jgi:hypothetical protein
MSTNESCNLILCEAKLQRSPESFRGEARLSISGQFRAMFDRQQPRDVSLHST